MREIEITIRVYNREHRAEEDRTVTAYADARFPGLAVHGPWELTDDEWRVTHVPSGLIVASLPTRAAATAALESIGNLQDWNRPQADVTPVEPGEWRWLKTGVAAVAERVKSDRGAALKAAVESGTIKAIALEAALGDFHCDKMRRAWRTRSNVTHSKWTEHARVLLGEAAALDDVWKLAAALYAACGDFSEAGQFTPAGPDAPLLENAFRPPENLPRRTAGKGPFARGV